MRPARRLTGEETVIPAVRKRPAAATVSALPEKESVRSARKRKRAVIGTNLLADLELSERSAASTQIQMTEGSVLEGLAKGIINDLPDEQQGQLLANLSSLEVVRVGSIFTGSDIAIHCWQEFLQAALGCAAGRIKTDHIMGVERVAWKREFLMRNHPRLRFLCGEAQGLQCETGYCYLNKQHVSWPHCDVLSVGSSCTDFSSLRRRKEGTNIERDVEHCRGSSGSTLHFAMTYIDKHRPRVLLFENVKGLRKGLWQKDAVTWRSIRDVHSNLGILLAFLEDRGYCAPHCMLNPSPRMPSNRRRLWLPCFFVGDGVTTRGINSLCTMATEVLDKLQSNTAATIGPEHLRLPPHTPEYEFWLERAIKERSDAATVSSADKRT